MFWNNIHLSLLCLMNEDTLSVISSIILFYRLIILCSLLSKEAATYTQGMTDLALPILAVLQDLPLAFRCYLKLLQKHSLFCTPQSLKKIDELMVRQLQRHDSN